MRSKKLVAQLIALLALTSCGGGSGGGTSSQPVSAASNSAASFTYTKLANMNVGTNADLLAGGLFYREEPFGVIGDSRLATSEFQTAIVQNSNGIIGNRITANKTFRQPDGNRYEADYDFSWVIELFDVALNIGNALDQFLYWYSQDGTFNDTVLITQTDYTAQGFGYWIDADLLANYLETEYVAPAIISVDYGRNCLFGGCDDDLAEDIIASVGGDFTAAGDMPAAGISYMNARGIALYHTKNMSRPQGSVQHLLAAESDGRVDIDHSAGTISGSLSFDAVFSERLGGNWPRVEGASAGDFQIAGVIIGNTATGTVTWGGPEYGSGFFDGAFFGPDGREFGGVIIAADDLEDEFSQIIASFVAESN